MKIHSLIAVCALSISNSLFAQTHVLQAEVPVVLQAHKLEPYELPAGTVFDLVLEQADDVMPIAMVSVDIFDFYRNVVIPRGSLVTGKYVGYRSGRHLVDWTELQLPSRAGSLRIEPPLLGVMGDGTTGYKVYKPGAAVGAVNGTEFIVPH